MKTYIIHVEGNEARKKHIDKELLKTGLEVEFVLEKNIEDLSDEFLNNYFTGKKLLKTGETSCASKHFIAYERFLNEKNENFALVIEDDMKFYDGFKDKLKNVIDEINQKNIENFLISLEDSRRKYIKRSERIKGQILYKNHKTRLTGIYLIDKKSAKQMISFANKEKTDLNIDNYHSYCSKNDIIEMYWSDLYLGHQGSGSGDIPSLLSDKKNKKFRKLYFVSNRIYKKFIYMFR